MPHLTSVRFTQINKRIISLTYLNQNQENWLLCRNGVKLCHQKKCLADSLLHNMNIGVVKITCARGRQSIFI